MRIRSSVAAVVGKTTETDWCQVLSLPGAYAVIEVHEPSGNARQRGISILSQLHRKLNPPPVSLTDIASLADSFFTPEVISLSILIPVGGILYIVLRGKGAVYVRRENQFATLLNLQGAVSGSVSLGDCVLLSTGGFVTALLPGEIAALFDHLSSVEVAEQLTLALHQKETDGAAASCIFQVTGMESEEVAPGPDQTQPVETLPRRSERFRSIFRRVPFRRSFISHALIRFRENPRKLKAAAVVAVIMLVFAVTVFRGISHKNESRQDQEARLVISQARLLYDEGSALRDLNPTRGRMLLKQAKDLLTPLLADNDAASLVGRDLMMLYGQVDETLTLTMQSYEIIPELFFDVSLLKKSAAASSFGLFEDTLGILDRNGKTAYTVSVATKNGAIAAGGDALSGAEFIAPYSDTLYVYLPRGIYGIKSGIPIPSKPLIPADSEWGKISSLVAFGGNVYLLDTVKSRIWKYVATEDGFSDRREYLNPDVLPDLSAAVSIAIDGSVWIGTGDGRIIKFTQGLEQSFAPKGVEPAISGQLVIYTDDLSSRIYVAERSGKRLVVLDKEGEYIAQYYWKSEITPQAMVISEKLKKALILSDGLIYAVTLK